MKIQDIKEALFKYGDRPEDLEGLKKKDLEQRLHDFIAANEQLNATEADQDSAIPFITATLQPIETKDQTHQVKPTDPAWTDFVLGKFVDTEKDADGNPKVDGLRRVAELLLGPFNIFTREVYPPKLDAGATVVVRLEFFNDFGHPTRIVEGSADVSSINTQREYAVHAVATAETRAEGRALRKALRLTKVLAAEELQNADKDEADGDSRISKSMINNLKMMCEKQSIDLDSLVKKEFDLGSVEELTPSEGRKIGTILYQYKTGEREIEDEVKSF